MSDALVSRSLIETLVAFDTTSHKSNMQMIEFIRDYLAQLNVESHLVFDKSGGKANLYATLGPTDRPGVMLSGHTDVVPVDGQDWHTDPFEVVEKEGRLYGRGTSDMKSFIAVVLAHVPAILERDLQTPVHLAFSYDEETGCIGVRRLIDMLNGLAVKPAMCIIGEPTMMKVVTAHKGKRSARAVVNGLECHSSLAPQGVNAVNYAAELMVFISQLAQRSADEGPFDNDYDVAHTTLHTGTVSGGTALNIVPRECTFEFEIRNLPGVDPEALLDEVKAYARDELEPRMHAVDASSGIVFEDLPSYPGLETDPEAEVVTLAKSLTQANDHIKIAFGTEGGLFQHNAHIPSVVCGPGSIAQAHKPNEFIALEQVAACEQFLERLIDKVTA